MNDILIRNNGKLNEEISTVKETCHTDEEGILIIADSEMPRSSA
jgi:hypothetical protein